MPLHQQKIPKSKVTTLKRPQKFRLHNGWINDIHRTGVVKPVYEVPTFPLTSKAVYSKDTNLKICK